MPRGRDWKKSDVRRAAEALRSGQPPDALCETLGRTQNALYLELRRTGHSPKKLLREGQLARVGDIVAKGGGVPEVMASEGVKEGSAMRLISHVLNKGDRRKCKLNLSQKTMRQIYLNVREHGFRPTARIMGLPLTTIRKVALRYRDEVLPSSPPLRGAKPIGRGNKRREPVSAEGRA